MAQREASDLIEDRPVPPLRAGGGRPKKLVVAVGFGLMPPADAVFASIRRSMLASEESWAFR
jgi:hypothetical protein